jgi:cell division protein FtsZ
VDFEDVKTVMGEQGKAMMGTATASGPDRARIAAEQAVRSPLLEGVDLSGARGILVNITANGSLKLKETKLAMETIRNFAAEDATIIFGTVHDESMADNLRVTVVATGLGRIVQRPKLVAPVKVPVYRTGTDDAVGSRADANDYEADEAPQESATTGNAYAGYEAPAIWRQPPKSEAAARVLALEEGGMDRLDIPAFLRKQAD